MRELSATLSATQQSKSLSPLVKISLSLAGEDDILLSGDRILDINNTEEPFSQTAEIVLDNSDGYFTNKDLQGWGAILSYGVLTRDGEEYSPCAPMKVLSQAFDSSPGSLKCRLKLIGIPNQMAYDEASESYMPASDDTKTVKTLLGEIIGATMTCFSHCEAFLIVWDSEDSLIDTYKPKDSFRVYVGGHRLAAVRRLLEYTKCVMRAEDDGKVHIFEPVTSGDSYDYEYSLESGHSFFSKAYRNRLVLPNYAVVQSQPDDSPQYSGTASDAGSYALLPKRTYMQTRLESNDQATAIAEAVIAQHQLWSEMGSASVPMNVGAEVFDYVKVGAFNSDDVYRVGNMGHLCRHYNADRNEWRMTFSFGNWMNVRKALANLDPSGTISTDDIEAYFTRLMVKDLYAENIMAENIDMIWIDPDGNVDLTLIGDTLDSLPDGATYARTRWLHLDAETGLTMKESQIYYVRLSPDSDEMSIRRQDAAPTPEFTGEYWIDTSGASSVIKRWTGSQWVTIDQDEIDALNRGILTTHIKLASLSVDGLVLLDEVVADTYGLVLSTSISAGKILLDEVEPGTYGLVKSTYISAGRIELWETTGDLGDIDGDLDDIGNGSTYGRVRMTDISAGHIYLVEDQDMDDQGFRIYSNSGSTYIVIRSAGIRGYNSDDLQFELDASDGRIHAGGGNVILDEDGINLTGFNDFIIFRYSDGGSAHALIGLAGYAILGIAANDYVQIYADGLRPADNGYTDLGDGTHYWDRGYIKEMYGTPILTDSVPNVNGALLPYMSLYPTSGRLAIRKGGAWRDNA